MFSRAYVEITNVCNMACAFCPGTAREKGFMTPETFALLAGKLRRHTDFLYLHVMGEPLLHPQLAEILRICGDLGFRVCLTTNGTLLADRLPLLRDCPALHKVSVSLHSFEGNGRRDGLEDYITQAADSCLALAEGGVRISASCKYWAASCKKILQACRPITGATGVWRSTSI